MPQCNIGKPWHCLLGVVGLVCSSNAMAQKDISGHWRKTNMESHYSETGIGNYNALPVNEAARVRADTWNPERLFMPEHQCEPHPAPYAPVGPANMRVEAIVDPRTQETIAWKMTLHWMENARTIWLDGRPHPPPWAPHTWGGFSTGEWDGDTLTVTTTHIKQAWIRRNGLPQSDQAVLREHWTVNGDILTLISVLQDPVYLTEPLIRSITWRRDPGYQIGSYTCYITRDIDHSYGYVPFNLPGHNTMLMDNLPAQWHLPNDAIRGGAHTLLPEYAETLKSYIGSNGRAE
jgi:hypothetical protein